VEAGPRESVIVRMVVKAILARDGIVDKVESRSRRGYFDLIAVLSGAVFFIETKRPRGGRLLPHQKFLHEAYRKAGARVELIRSEADLNRWLSTL
jgi:hypothetical protein